MATSERRERGPRPLKTDDEKKGNDKKTEFYFLERFFAARAVDLKKKMGWAGREWH